MQKKVRPYVAAMALAYVGSPGMKLSLFVVSGSSTSLLASSVDAERAFSVGHRQINFMQHNMASTTFRSKMCLGSWQNTPLFPGLQKASSILEEKMRPAQQGDGEVGPSSAENSD
jgi:hypothetical protein